MSEDKKKQIPIEETADETPDEVTSAGEESSGENPEE